MDPFTIPALASLLDLAATALTGLTSLLEPVTGDLAAAASIVAVTLLVRAILVPTGIAQAKAEQARSRLAPRLRRLQQRYGRNRERLQRETMQLYRDEKVSPFAGCLPVLAQAPVLGLLYTIFIRPTIGDHPNALLAQTLFGVPLGESLVGSAFAGTLGPTDVAVFAAIIGSIALVGELTRRAFRPTVDTTASAPGAAGAALASVPVGLLGALQFATAVVAVFVPIAAGLYLAVSAAWTLVQRMLLRRRYPLAPAR